MYDLDIEEKLPKFVDIPVYRSDYITQEQADRICRLVWDKDSLAVCNIAYAQEIDMDHSMFDRACDNIEFFLIEEAEKGTVESLSDIQRIDLVFEILRRVRFSMNKPEPPVLGDPIAPGPQGPFMPMINKPIRENRWIGPDAKFTQEIADKYVPIGYEQNPEMVYAFTESLRRVMGGGLAGRKLNDFFRSLLKGTPEEDMYYAVYGELMSRIYEMSKPVYKNVRQQIENEKARLNN